MQWKDVGDVLAKSIGPAASVAVKVLTGNVPGAVAEVAGWLSGATGQTDFMRVPRIPIVFDWVSKSVTSHYNHN